MAVRAAGVNFRDVLIALGMYPEEQTVLGSEGAGVVLEVGSRVRDLAVGDRVMGMLSGAFGPVACADHRQLARVLGVVVCASGVGADSLLPRLLCAARLADSAG